MDFGCDEIKCINLVQRTDKRKLVEETMKKLEINIDFFLIQILFLFLKV